MLVTQKQRELSKIFKDRASEAIHWPSTVSSFNKLFAYGHYFLLKRAHQFELRRQDFFNILQITTNLMFVAAE